MRNDRCGLVGPLKRSYVITGSHTPFEQGPRGCLPTLPGKIRPGNVSNLDLTDSTHLSVWSSSPRFMLAGLAGSVSPYKSFCKFAICYNDLKYFCVNKHFSFYLI